jgi:hypothetical protein
MATLGHLEVTHHHNNSTYNVYTVGDSPSQNTRRHQQRNNQQKEVCSPTKAKIKLKVIPAVKRK